MEATKLLGWGGVGGVGQGGVGWGANVTLKIVHDTTVLIQREFVVDDVKDWGWGGMVTFMNMYCIFCVEDVALRMLPSR